MSRHGPLLLLLFLGLLLVLESPASRAEDMAVGELRLRVGEVESAAGSLEHLGGDARAQLASAVTELRRVQSEIADEDMALESEESELEGTEGRIQTLRIEWESALSRYERFSELYDQEESRLGSELKHWEKLRDDHNAKDPDKMSPAELDAWNREAEEGNLRMELLEAKFKSFYAEKGGEKIRLRIEASERERDYRLAKAEHDRKKMALDARRGELKGRTEAALADARGLLDLIERAREGVRPAERVVERFEPATYVEESRVVPMLVGQDPGVGRAPPVLARRVYVLEHPRGALASDPARAALAAATRRAAVEHALSGYVTERPRPVASTTSPERPAARPIDTTELVRAPRGASAAAAGPQVFDPQARLPEPKLRISATALAEARRQKDVLGRKIELLGAELDKVMERRRGNQAELTPFQQEAERALSIRGIVGDIAGAIPFDSWKKGLTATKTAADALKAARLERVETGLKLLKAGLDATHQDPGETDAARARREIEVLVDAEDAAESLLGSLPKDHPLLRGTDGMRKLVKLGVLAHQFQDEQLAKDGQRTWSEVVGDGAKLGIDIGSIFVPVIGVGKATYGLGERAATYFVVKPAIESLEAAVAKDYEAERFLMGRMERLQRAYATQEQILELAEREGVAPGATPRSER